MFSKISSRRLVTSLRSFSTATATHTRVAIVGGGPSGTSVSAQLVNSNNISASDITIIEPSLEHHYQPGYTCVGGGVWNESQKSKYLIRPREENMNKDINWVRQAVTTLDPDNNRLTTSDGNIISYDYLVMASGVELRYDLIPGSVQAIEDEDCPVGSIYRLPWAEKMSRLRSEFKGGNAIFTLPTMPVKCGGAPQKIMYLSEETFRKNKIRDKTNMHWYTSAPNMFPVKKYADALFETAKSKKIDIHFQHLIKSVDGSNRLVTFTDTSTKEELIVSFDLLHVVPPQTAHQFVRDSPLTDNNNCVEVDHKTLRHKKYSNVFALGDVANLPTAKTAAAVFAQAPVVTHNLIRQSENDMGGLPRPLAEGYDGYSSCPLFVGDNKLMLMEFKYGNVPKETFCKYQEKPHQFYYYMKKEFFPRVYWKYMPTGDWYGSRGPFKPKF